jgi:cell division protease FtsH
MNIDERMMSTRTSHAVETEMKVIVDECYQEVFDLLKINKIKLEQLKDILITEEIVDGVVVYELVASCDVPISK